MQLCCAGMPSDRREREREKCAAQSLVRNPRTIIIKIGAEGRADCNGYFAAINPGIVGYLKLENREQV